MTSEPECRAVPLGPVLRRVPALARGPAVVLGLLRPCHLLGVARRRAPGRGGLRRRAGGAGLAARRTAAVQLPARPRRHAPRARRLPRPARRPASRGPPGTPTTWWWPPTARPTPGTSASTSTASTTDRRMPATSPPRRSSGWTPTAPAARRRTTSPSPTARSSPRTVGTLIIAESMGGRLTAFDRAEDGTLTNRRDWAVLPGIAPDGICLCADGTVWVANAWAPSASASPRVARCSSG